MPCSLPVVSDVQAAMDVFSENGAVILRLTFEADRDASRYAEVLNEMQNWSIQRDLYMQEHITHLSWANRSEVRG